MSEQRLYNIKFLTGCGFILLLGLITLSSFIAYNIQRDRRAAHYPDAISISQHNYYRLPTFISWQDYYLTDDNFTAVYQWYSTGFDLGAEARANGSCIELDGDKTSFRIERRTHVSLCHTPRGQTIFITRTTQWR